MSVLTVFYPSKIIIWLVAWRIGLQATHRSRGIGGERGKVKSSHSIIGMLHNGGVVGQALASTLPEASAVPTVEHIYTDILITIMNHQRHTLALNTLFILLPS